MAAYEAKTQNDLAKWWVIGTGSTVNRLSEIMDDCPNGPAIYYTTGWTVSGSEYYRTQATANDSCQEKIGAGAWSALVLGAGVGSLNAGEYYWNAADTRLYVRLTGDAAPNATNQVRAHYLWDGSGAGPEFMREIVEDRMYYVPLAMDIGDDTTATTLSSLHELVYFGGTLTIQGNTTTTLGQITQSVGCKGSAWSVAGCNTSALSGCTLNAYGSLLMGRGGNTISLAPQSGAFIDTIADLTATPNYTFSLTNLTLTRGVVSNNDSPAGYIGLNSGMTITDLVTNGDRVASYGTSNHSISRAVLTYSPVDIYLFAGVTLTLIDMTEPGSVTINNASGIIKLNYTVALHIADKDGADLSGATVTWLDSQSNTGNDDTDASGNVSFTLTSKQWATTSETLTDFNTFIFTISKTGYQTLTLENITLSEAVDWHLELQPGSLGARFYNIGIGMAA